MDLGTLVDRQPGVASVPAFAAPLLFPIQQMPIQKELTELLIKLHRPYLEKLFTGQAKDEVDSDSLSSSAILELFLANLRQVANHSSLLVDHFMSRNMVLMNPKHNLKRSSAKYVCIDDFLSRLAAQKQPRTVILTAASSRELDLIEGILIGKRDLQYYRFSGSSLYYDNHGSFDFNKQELSNPAMPLPQVAAANGKTNGTDDYTPRISKNSPLHHKIEQQKNRVVSVYLILSNQLQSLARFEELRSDLVISLDAQLAQNLAIPVIKPVYLNGIEYFDLVLDSAYSGDERAKHLAKLVLVNRNAATESPGLQDVVNWLDGHGSYPYTESKKIETVSDNDALEALASLELELPYRLDRYEFFNPSLAPKDDPKKLKLEESPLASLTYHQYQLRLGRLIYDRYQELLFTVDAQRKHLADIHEDDSQRQAQLEAVVEATGDRFRKLQTTKTAAESLAKQVAKCEKDLRTVEETDQRLKERMEEYTKRVRVGATESALLEQQNTITALQDELKQVEAGYQKEMAENESVRAEYQQKSSAAAEMSSKLMETKKKLEAAQTESKGDFRKLQQTKLDRETEMYKKRTQSLASQNKFLEKYIKILDNAAKEKATVGRIRASRSTTPYQ
ncbi:hypothetical protein KL942_004430 [Ogataea angusta]|uniref:HDA1 complex subunit 2 n=1 Tax=Pichia angusta TaxID=870730 RepID=A0ABQ7RUE5_PICAN|nr:hypothetical protein KL942_004430 [Ogataea angusta]KAG7847651.1 hypothetical protein KL940_003563 [Ogataea angusta]